MQTRRIFLKPDEVLEVILPAHPASSGEQQSVLKVRAFRTFSGQAQVLAYSQPFARLHVDLPQYRADALDDATTPPTQDSNDE